ncbi:hypothetical protein B9G69_001225 [Bdellovibrio sp. SKB1291214]|uniref:hypothetical protein n=1 Tax=Bdellovibrio sp. SKB1291214 TaxID=1732569 RepID=UPI000B517E62|nr:hypothetical protein [Bdellovibrio sp. SKB1291214]UYL09197.1 hypothetical protein B9G69_001225 [Bdellovibrio sp. SKB1291214]
MENPSQQSGEGLQSKFWEISSALKTQYANLNLSEAQIRDALKSPDDLINMISEKTGISKEAATEKVHSLMAQYNISDDQAKSFMSRMTEKVEHGIDTIKSKFIH